MDVHMESIGPRRPVPLAHRQSLLPVARKVFWWGNPEEWLEDSLRFAAQVMTFGDWEDVCTALRLLGDDLFVAALQHPPPGVFDPKSWNFWHVHYRLPVPPLPARRT